MVRKVTFSGQFSSGTIILVIGRDYCASDGTAAVSENIV